MDSAIAPDRHSVISLRNPNYAGAVNYLKTIIENGKIILELPEVSAEQDEPLSCSAPPWSN